MNQKPPRVAAWLIELFAPMECAEGVLGDLEEEFAGRLQQSGCRAARRWYRHQAVRTTVHLSWGSIRSAPWSTPAQVLASFVVGLLLYGVVSIWVARLVSNLPIYDYDISVWSWRVAAFIRLVLLPVALGWSIAAFARDREMVMTTLVVGLVVGMSLLGVVAADVRLHVSGPGPRMGPFRLLTHVLEIVLTQLVLPLGIVAGGMVRRLQQLRRSAERLA